jgi:hypothetical protein
VRRVRLHPDELAAEAQDADALGEVLLEEEQVLEVRVTDDRVEALVGERELRRVEVDVVRLDAAARGPLGADARDVRADHVRALVLQELREEARPAARLEDALAGLHAVDDHRQALVVDLPLGELGPVPVVVVAQVHRDQTPIAAATPGRRTLGVVRMTSPSAAAGSS